jgi:hypothetical protein
LFLTGQAGPILKDKVEEIVRGFDQDLTARGYPADVRQSATDALRRRLLEDVVAGRSTFFSPSSTSLDKTPLALANVRGPVSANPIGIYEGGYAFVFPLDSPQATWNSFNAGEFLFPGRRVSLLPLLVCCGGLAAWILRGLFQRSRRLPVEAPLPNRLIE